MLGALLVLLALTLGLLTVAARILRGLLVVALLLLLLFLLFLDVLDEIEVIARIFIVRLHLEHLLVGIDGGVVLALLRHRVAQVVKTSRIAVLREVADRHGIGAVADGTNADDLDDYRPGMRAAREAADLEDAMYERLTFASQW